MNWGVLFRNAFPRLFGGHRLSDQNFCRVSRAEHVMNPYIHTNPLKTFQSFKIRCTTFIHVYTYIYSFLCSCLCTYIYYLIIFVYLFVFIPLFKVYIYAYIYRYIFICLFMYLYQLQGLTLLQPPPLRLPWTSTCRSWSAPSPMPPPPWRAGNSTGAAADGGQVACHMK